MKTRKKKEPDVRFIKCRQHNKEKKLQKLPWSIVCVHLLDGAPQKWPRLPQEPPGNGWDYLCKTCLDQFENTLDLNLNNVRPICVKCVEQIRFILDKDYKA